MSISRRLWQALTPLLALILGLLLVAGLLPAAGPVAAANEGRLEIKVLNGSADNKPVANQAVKLLTGTENQQGPPADLGQKTTDENGVAVWENLKSDAGQLYQARTTFRDAEYPTETLEFTPDKPIQRSTLMVYDATAEDPGLTFDTVRLIVVGVDPNAKTVGIVENVNVNNPSKKAYIGTSDAGNGPRATVRYPLPGNVLDVNLRGDLATSQVIGTMDGFTATAPVRPGVSTLIMTYTVPYQTDSIDMVRQFTYPVKEIRLALPADSPVLVRSDTVNTAGTTDLNGRQYRLYTSGALAKGTPVTIRLQNLPAGTSSDSGGFNLTDRNALIIAAGALLALLLLGLGIYLWRRRRTLGGGPGKPATEEEELPERLLKTIAELDAAYEEGAIDEADYQRDRQAAKDRLRAAIRKQTERSVRS